MERSKGKLFIGEGLDPESGDRNGHGVQLDSADFTTHGVIVGMTGSGKTGLGMVLLEETLLSGVPVLAIDPKGDLGNLCLTFPDLAPVDFEPWMDAGTARVEGTTTAALAEKTASMWKDGLAGWQLDGTDVAQLRSAARPIIYTPGANHGVPLDVLGRLTAPATTDPSARLDEVDATVSGLLGLIGVDSDPLSGREHILMANLIARAWDAGNDLDLPTLLAQLLDPPIRKLGVLDLDTFFPAADRQALVMRLNGLLASPSFASWAEGAPVDIERMLWDADGSARAAIISLGHLEETERQFAITLILSKLISWMRTQAGTSELRAMVYLDEVMGLAPPVGNPPTKKPILTLLKQARAFGVGLVLSTQNPVDLDYKAISNAGTWLIGRLQTDQDKNRLVDGLRGADGAVDIAEVERTISGLGKRQFVLRTSKSSALPKLTTRWAMSYLAGPLTREQIATLMDDKRAAAVGSPSPAGGQAATPTPATAAATATASAAPEAAPLADDESTVPPTLPSGMTPLTVRASAPWLDTLGIDPSANRLEPALAARVSLLFDDTKADLRHTEEWEAIIPLTGRSIDVAEAVEVDFDDRDFTDTMPGGSVYVLPSFELTTTLVNQTQRDLKDHLYAKQSLALLNNPELKLWSRPGESADDFGRRCQEAAETGADADAEKIRAKLEAKRSSIETAIAKAEDRVAELETQAAGARNKSIIDIGSSILGGLLGGRKRSSSLATAARRAASGNKSTSAVNARLESARNRAAEKIDDLEQLELDLQEAMIEIDDEWNQKAAVIETVEIPLEKTDITVADMDVVWLPRSR
ncbi:MAG: DUF87 domain-containing protein [Acidimicrobiales bacterium]